MFTPAAARTSAAAIINFAARTSAAAIINCAGLITEASPAAYIP
jgi:hypothetical protein